MAEDTFKVDANTKLLENFYKAMKNANIVAKIGVLGAKDKRSSGSGTSNATIGAAHEYGSFKNNLPQRSFLRMPIETKLQGALDKAGFFDRSVLNKISKTGDLEPLVTKVAIAAVAVVLEAFNSGGFGNWQPSNMEYKKVKQTLIETHQLRDSIDYEVTKKK